MVNRIKDIVNKLDGYSSDNQGFAVTAFTVNELGIELSVKPYLKNEEIEGIPEHEQLGEIIERLLNHYSEGAHYEVLEAVKTNGKYWKLSVSEVQDKKPEDKADEA